MATAIACEEFEWNRLMDDARPISILERIRTEKVAFRSHLESIAAEIDKEINKVYAELAELLVNNFNLCEMLRSNLEIEAALRITIGRDPNEPSTSSAPDISSTEAARVEACESLAGCVAEEVSKDAVLTMDAVEVLMDIVCKNINFLKKNLGHFREKANEANNCNVCSTCNVTRFYNTLVSKYEDFIISLEDRLVDLEIVRKHLKESIENCTILAALAAKVTNETLDESRKRALSTCASNKEVMSVIIVALKRKRKAILVMAEIFTLVKEETNEKIIQKRIEDRKTIKAYVVLTIIGLGVFSLAFFFEIGSKPFYLFLVFGAVICTLLWSTVLYNCLRRKKRVSETAQPETREGFLRYCDDHVAMLEDCLRKYNVQDFESE